MVTGEASQDRVLVIGSMAAAQSGQYQQAVHEAGQGGEKQVEMHMADRLTDGGEPTSTVHHLPTGLAVLTPSHPRAHSYHTQPLHLRNGHSPPHTF